MRLPISLEPQPISVIRVVNTILYIDITKSNKSLMPMISTKQP